mgnify:CR=1 FL=1
MKEKSKNHIPEWYNIATSMDYLPEIHQMIEYQI